MSKNYQEVNGFTYVKNVFGDEVNESKNLNLQEEESMFDRSKEIKDLKLKAKTALFWGDDAEDVKILENVDKDTFDKVSEAFEDRPAFYSGYNDDEMFEILFSMDDVCAYDLIEDYNKEWGRFIEIVTE